MIFLNILERFSVLEDNRRMLSSCPFYDFLSFLLTFSFDWKYRYMFQHSKQCFTVQFPSHKNFVKDAVFGNGMKYFLLCWFITYETQSPTRIVLAQLQLCSLRCLLAFFQAVCYHYKDHQNNQRPFCCANFFSGTAIVELLMWPHTGLINWR